MRDDQIYKHFELMTDAVKSDMVRLQRGLSLVRTRQDAFERLILGNRFGLLRMALFQIIMPSYVAKLMNSAHSDEIRQYEEAQRAAARRKPAVMQAPTPGLIVA